MRNDLDQKELRKRLIASIDRRYQAHAGKDLADYIFANHLFQTVEPDLIDFSYRYRREIADYLSDETELATLVDYCVEATKRYTYQRNQFINITPTYDKLLTREYRDFLEQLKTLLDEANSVDMIANAYTKAMEHHHERLRLILSTYCLAVNEQDLPKNPLLRTVPCEEYSVPFQLSLLHIELPQIEEPVLDLGCGEAGALVEFLRGEGLDAFGLDRLAPSRPHYFRQDWFAFDYGARAWGMIIAHQSFSTHFIHNHLHSPARARQYAELYMQIVSSLRPEGAFYYAPGLPFIESHLEKTGRYSVTKTTISADKILGIGEIFYSVKVTKNRQTILDEASEKFRKQ